MMISPSLDCRCGAYGKSSYEGGLVPAVKESPKQNTLCVVVVVVLAGVVDDIALAIKIPIVDDVVAVVASFLPIICFARDTIMKMEIRLTVNISNNCPLGLRFLTDRPFVMTVGTN